MNPPTLTRRQVRDIDRRAIDDYGMTGLVLMENAGRGAAELLHGLGIQGPVTIVCGKGNNAGDGFVIARRLDFLGHAVRVTLAVDPEQLTGDAAANLRILERAQLPIHRYSDIGLSGLQRHLASSAWVVDALLGTGAVGPPREPVAQIVNLINDARRPVLAVDLPSGLDCDTGEPASPTIIATHTATFVAAKPGFLSPAAGAYLGQWHVLDIGIPRRLLEEVLGRPD